MNTLSFGTALAQRTQYFWTSGTVERKIHKSVLPPGSYGNIGVDDLRISANLQKGMLHIAAHTFLIIIYHVTACSSKKSEDISKHQATFPAPLPLHLMVGKYINNTQDNNEDLIKIFIAPPLA